MLNLLKNVLKTTLFITFGLFLMLYLFFGAILQTSERIESYELSQAVNGD